MRRIATGSPITKSPIDLWGQFVFLGSRLLGSVNYWAFRAKYCNLADQWVANRKIQMIVGYKNLSELSDLVAKHSFRVLKEECLDLPSKIYAIRDVDLTDEQGTMYDDLRRLAVAEFIGQFVTATVVMTRLLRLHQILCGVVIDDDGKEIEIPSRRVDQLLDICEETGDQSIIVWCAYRRNVQTVCDALRGQYGRLSTVEYHGGSSQEDRADALSRFESGSARFFVATPPTAGRGITLNRASVVVYYSNTYDLEQRMQSEDRCHRIGQTKSVTYIDLMVRGSIDEKIVDSLRKKIDLATMVMRDDPVEWLK
jgi:SNF2 family DNA or RNA helicase